jgi:ATP-dependent helicase/nuclease subunit A
MSAEEISWTDAQRRAIGSLGHSLLVSAAAGSGKTAVLAERCAFLVCDAPQPCDVDQLLVVTFTEAAAAEMRQRIAMALRRRVESLAHPTPRLRRQLALVEHAHISTIHGFCARLLRQNFSLAKLDPRFHVIDPDEAALLRREVARALFDDRYERDAVGQFGAFIDDYGDGRDESPMDRVITGHEMLCSLESPRNWLNNSMSQITESANKPLAESQLGRQFLAAIQTALDRLKLHCAAGIGSIQSLGSFAGYVTTLKDWSRTVVNWDDLFHLRGYDVLADEFRRFDPGRAPAVKSDTPKKEQAKSILDAVKDQMREGELADLLAFTQVQWRQGQRTISAHAGLFLDLLLDFGRRYAEAKTNLRAVDFADLERKTLNLLRDTETWAPSVLARAYHRQYQHVLVDEYQDVNEIQDAILRLVSAECVAAEGNFAANLFTVGDVKQSIYRFRLAEPKRFLERNREFRREDNKIGMVIDLRENFRSRPALLEAVNQVFERLMTGGDTEIEYDESHRLRPGLSASSPSAESPIEIHVLPSMGEEDEEDSDRTEREAMLCARLIRDIVGDRGNFGDVAILLRSLRFKAEKFAEVLRRHGIPVHHGGGTGFLEATEIRDVTALLSLLDNQRQDVPLAAFLRSPLSGLSNAEELLARIRLGSLSADAPIPFHEAAVRFATEQQNEWAARLREVLARLSRWRDAARQRPLADVIWQIYDDTGYLAFVSGLDNGPQRVANVLYLHQRARQFGSFLKQGLHRFMDFLARLREEKDIGLPSVLGQGEKAVRVMSIHVSKGLEFPIVIVPDLGKHHNFSDAHGSILMDRRAGLGLRVIDADRRIYYPSLSWILTESSLKRQTLAEELRLLYVAMTRAKERLLLIGTASEKAVEKWARDFRGHAGPLPSDVILSAGSMLDWLGPVQATCGDRAIKLTAHSAEEVRSWSAEQAGRTETTESQRDLAALKPLNPPPAMDADARAIIARLEFNYPHEEFTKLPAATSPTALKPDAPSPGAVVRELPLPPFLSAHPAALSATDVGTATHLLLEHLDFCRPCDLPDVEAQIAQLVDRRLMLDVQAAAVDRAAIVWLMSTDLGSQIKANGKLLRREVAFAGSLAAGRDPLDAVMLRGRIDVIVPTGAGVAVVDYKTDRVTAEGVKERAESYQAQIAAYRDALKRVAGKAVTGVYLVFLYPRVVHFVA